MSFEIGSIVHIDFRSLHTDGIVLGFNKTASTYEIAVPNEDSILESASETDYLNWMHITIHSNYLSNIYDIVRRLKTRGINQAIVCYDSDTKMYIVKVRNHHRFNSIRNKGLYFLPMSFLEKFTIGIKLC